MCQITNGAVFTCIPLLLSASISSAPAAPVVGGTLDPLTIPKYVTQLSIPPVLYDDNGGKRPLNVQVALRQISQQVLPPADINGNPLPATTLWAYGDPARANSFYNPAITFEVTQDTPSTVTWINQLVVDPIVCYVRQGPGKDNGEGKGDCNNDDRDDEEASRRGNDNESDCNGATTTSLVAVTRVRVVMEEVKAGLEAVMVGLEAITTINRRVIS